MKAALVIGHEHLSQGARNVKFNLTEFNFNTRLVKKIIEEYKVRQRNTNIIQKDIDVLELREVYRTTYRDLPDILNNLDPDFTISFHANAFNNYTSGTETLYYHSSAFGLGIARIIQSNVVFHLGLRDRGIKPKHSEERGGYLLRYTNAPTVITEPFFIDNDIDCYIVKERFESLVDAYLLSLDEIQELFRRIS
jgi:N-acetylmuramoyl-L-alanine amidase